MPGRRHRRQRQRAAPAMSSAPAGSRRPGDSGLAFLPGGASATSSAAFGQQRARSPGVRLGPVAITNCRSTFTAGALLRCRRADNASQSSRPGGWRPTSQQELRQVLRRGWSSSSASRSATTGVRPENSATAAGTSARSLSPAAARRRPGDPALGATPESLDVSGGETVLAECGEQLGGLGQRQRQIALAELGEPAPAPPPADGQVRVDPARQQHPRAPGQVLDDEGETFGDLRAPQVMNVLEHDDQRLIHGRPRGGAAGPGTPGQPHARQLRRRGLGEGTGIARCRARTNVSQKRSGRSSPASSVTDSRADRVQGPNHCATDTVLPVGRPGSYQRRPASSAGQEPRPGAHGQNRPEPYRWASNFDAERKGPPSETSTRATRPIRPMRSRGHRDARDEVDPAPWPGSGPGHLPGRGPACALGPGDGNSPVPGSYRGDESSGKVTGGS